MTHTLGPWLFDGCAQIVEEARPHMRVAFLPSDHAEYASSKANGRLIAAAPALYEACASVWLMLADTSDNELRLIADECRAALSLVSKDGEAAK